MTGTRLSVVVPTRDRADAIMRLVGQLLADPALDELVVVDDGSTDGTAEQLRGCADDPRLRLVRLPGAGAGAARQAGVERATGELVLLLDDDVRPTPGLLAGHRDAHAARAPGAPPLVVVGSMPTQVPAERDAHTVTTDIYARDYAACTADWSRDPATVLGHLWAGNLSLPRATALEVGLDDPRIGRLFFEDQDLGLRLTAAGAHAVFRPELRADHDHRRSLRGYLNDGLRQGRALVVLSGRYPDRVAPPTVAAVAGRAPAPARWLVALAARGGPAGAAVCEAVLATTVLAGHARAWRLQLLLATLLRRVGQAKGAAEQRATDA